MKDSGYLLITYQIKRPYSKLDTFKLRRRIAAQLCSSELHAGLKDILWIKENSYTISLL